MLLGAASAHDTSLEQTSGLSGMLAGVADSQSEGGVGAANGRVTRRQMIFDPAASEDPQLAGLYAACVAAQPAAVCRRPPALLAPPPCRPWRVPPAPCWHARDTSDSVSVTPL